MKHLSMRGARPSLRLTRAAGLLLAIVLPLFGAGVARADDEFTTGFPHFLFEQSWTVPEGVTAATMELTGAAGGDFGGQGAEGGVIRATLTGLSPGTSFAVCLGGDGKQAISAFVPGGGVNGGGNAPLGGFGGGGATDIRLSGNCLDGADMRPCWSRGAEAVRAPSARTEAWRARRLAGGLRNRRCVVFGRVLHACHWWRRWRCSVGERQRQRGTRRDGGQHRCGARRPQR